MNQEKIDTPTLIVITFLLMALINGLMSCSNKIYKTPTRKEIKHAMKYSTWEYTMPKHNGTYNIYQIQSH
jgi:hypothetical protein